MRAAARLAAGAALTALLSGCITVGTDFVPPAPEMTESYDAPVPEPVGALPPPAVDDIAWWQAFRDPVLDRLVATSLAGNPGLGEAASRVREAQATARGVAAQDDPTLGASGTAGLRSDRTLGPARSRVGGSGSDDPTVSGSAGLGLAFGWVPDLFGGQQRAEEAAEAEIVRQAWLRRQAALAVVAETARTYVALRSVQNLQDVAQESLDLQRQTLGLVEGRTQAGLAPQLDLSRAQAAVASLEADLAPTASEIRRLGNALAVLAGERPGGLDIALGRGDIPMLEAGPPIGLPTDLLRRRPDLQAAEANLARAVAETGVAEAEFYPSLRLPGELTLSAAGLGTGNVVQTVLAALSAALSLPLLDGGLRAANLEAAEERAVQAVYAYRSTLLTALQEVEAALLTYQGAQAQLAALETTVDANERAFAQADALYRQGLASFLDVLDAQRALNVSRRQRLLAATELAQASMNIYEAAGLAPELPPIPPREAAAS